MKESSIRRVTRTGLVPKSIFPRGIILKKPLLIIRFTDGYFILEPTEAHVRGRQYREEAIGVFGRMVRRKPKELSFHEKNMADLTAVLGFSHPEAIKNLSPIEHKGSEFHPVVLDLSPYLLSSVGVLAHVKKRDRAKIVALQAHPLAERLQKRLG